jgi:hypothetical protein
VVRRRRVEVFGKPFAPLWMPWALAGGAGAALVIGVIALWQLMGGGSRNADDALATRPTATADVPATADAGNNGRIPGAQTIPPWAMPLQALRPPVQAQQPRPLLAPCRVPAAP